MLIGATWGGVVIGPDWHVGIARAATEGVGQASVIDGDTLEIHGERIRLWGVDAPESRQTCDDASGTPYRCGQKSALALDARISGRPVACARVDTDRYGRTVARCRVGGQDLGGWLVRNGYAIDYRRYSHGRYAGEEAKARQFRVGIWSGAFEDPADWRHRRH